MAHVRKTRSGRWQVRYRSPNGKERAKNFERKLDASRFAASVELTKAKGQWVDPRLGRRSFESWVSEWLTTLVDLRTSTLDRERRVLTKYLLPRFGAVPLAKITTTEVRGFIAELNDERRSAASVRKIGQVLAKIMAAAVEEGLIMGSPCVGLRLPLEPRREMLFLNSGEVDELASAIGAHYRPLIYTAAYGGLRWGELAGLRVERFDPRRRAISVVEQLTEVAGQLSFGPPKTKAGHRTVSIPAFLAEMLSIRIAEGVMGPRDLLFVSPDGSPMRRSNFRRRAWTPALVATGLNLALRFHDLRHTAVALAIAQGAHPKAIQERMGHSSITVTFDRYGHLFPALDEDLAVGLDDLYRRSHTRTHADSSRTFGTAESGSAPDEERT